VLHLSTETYNNEQVSKVFKQNFAETCPKMDYFGSKSQKITKRWGFCHHQSSLPLGATPQTPVQVK